jgi:hypothetical protein
MSCEQSVRYLEAGTCCLCGQKYTLYGNNPWPLSTVETDRCCRKCDDERVIPERLRLFRAQSKTNAALKTIPKPTSAQT